MDNREEEDENVQKYGQIDEYLDGREGLVSPSARIQTSQSEKDLSSASTKLYMAAGLCLLFMTIEIIGGYIAGSLAIMTDAAHLLSDVAGFLISIFALKISDLAATKTLSYGYRRAEVLGALFSVVLIWVLTGGLIIEATNRTRAILTNTREHLINGKIMTIIAIIGVFSNLVLLKVLGHNHSHGGASENHGHSHNHNSTNHDSEIQKRNNDNSYQRVDIHTEHSHSHGTTDGSLGTRLTSRPDGESNGYGSIPIVEKQELSHDINVSAAYVHAMGDLVQSIGVCIAGGLIWLFPGEKYPLMQLADPIATFVFSVLVVATTYQVLRTSVTILMQGVPEGVDAHEICTGLEGLPGVVGIHHLHIWSITIGEPSLSVHVQVANVSDMNPVLKRVQHYLRMRNFHHSTVQIEVHNEKYCHPEHCEGTCDDYALRCHDGACHPYRTL